MKFISALVFVCLFNVFVYFIQIAVLSYAILDRTQHLTAVHKKLEKCAYFEPKMQSGLARLPKLGIRISDLCAWLVSDEPQFKIKGFRVAAECMITGIFVFYNLLSS